MKLVILFVFACIMALAGAYLRVAVDSGYWYVLPMVLCGAIALGYVVGNAEDKADYHRIIAKVQTWLRR